MRAVFGNSSIGEDLYNTTLHAPLGESLGLRHEYRWGIYGHCAYIYSISTYGVCGNHTFANSWNPFETLRADIPPQYFVQVNEFIIQPLRDSSYLGTLSHVAFYLIFVSTLATILVIPLYVPVLLSSHGSNPHPNDRNRGLIKTTLTFLFAAIFSIAGATALLIAASMWTSVVSHVQATNQTRTGIVADYGQALWLTWAAFAFTLVSVLPYVMRYAFIDPPCMANVYTGSADGFGQSTDVPTL